MSAISSAKQDLLLLIGQAKMVEYVAPFRMSRDAIRFSLPDTGAIKASGINLNSVGGISGGGSYRVNPESLLRLSTIEQVATVFARVIQASGWVGGTQHTIIYQPGAFFSLAERVAKQLPNATASEDRPKGDNDRVVVLYVQQPEDDNYGFGKAEQSKIVGVVCAVGRKESKTQTAFRVEVMATIDEAYIACGAQPVKGSSL